MKSLKILQRLLGSGKPIADRYPDFNKYDGKVHILFVAPQLNASGYYRMIAPSLELTGSETHCALISQINTFDFARTCDEHDSSIETELVEWAHYIVLPTMFNSAEYVLKEIKGVNPDVEIVMDLDRLYHGLPSYHPDYKKIGEEKLSQLWANILIMDMVTCATSAIADYYLHKAAVEAPRHRTYFAYVPTLLRREPFHDRVGPCAFRSGRARIGLVAHSGARGDLMTIWNLLNFLERRWSDRVEPVSFGWDGQLENGKNLFEIMGVSCTYVPAVPFTKYHERLSALGLDMLLLPAVDNSYNRSRPEERYLEAAALGIPVVAAGQLPHERCIIHGETGFLATTEGEFLNAIGELVESRELASAVAKKAFEGVWERFGYSDENLCLFREAYS